MDLAFRIGGEFQLSPGQGIEPCAGGPTACIPTGPYTSLGKFLSSVLPNIYTIASIILFVLLIVSGLLFIINAGKADEEAAKKNQKTITASLVGFLIIFASYWIIEIIQTITGIDILKGGL